MTYHNRVDGATASITEAYANKTESVSYWALIAGSIGAGLLTGGVAGLGIMAGGIGAGAAAGTAEYSIRNRASDTPVDRRAPNPGRDTNMQYARDVLSGRRRSV